MDEDLGEESDVDSQNEVGEPEQKDGGTSEEDEEDIERNIVFLKEINRLRGPRNHLEPPLVGYNVTTLLNTFQ